MSNASDMLTPVTRGELREDLARLATKAELREEVAKLATKAELREEVAKLATKVELREEVAKLATKVELQEAVAKLPTKVELDLWGGALMARMDGGMRGLQQQIQQQGQILREEMQTMRQELHADLARWTNAVFESTQTMIRALDDKYASLPARVKTLESTVFGEEPR